MKRDRYSGNGPELNAGDIPKRAFGKTGEMLSVIGPDLEDWKKPLLASEAEQLAPRHDDV